MARMNITVDLDHLAAELARNWWALLLRGILAIAFALLTWVQPAISITAMIWVFGAYVLADGLLGIWAAIQRREHRWALLLWGIASVAAGVGAFLMPGITALALLYLIAAWACVIGVMQIVAAVELRRVIANEWWLILAGVLSVAFGVLLLVWPLPGTLAIAWLIAAYVFVLGALLVLVALRLRKLAR